MNRWWWLIVAVLVAVVVVAGTAAALDKPEPVVVAPVVAEPRPIQFSTGTYIVGTEPGPNHSNVIGPGTYVTDGTGGPNGLCMYRVTRDGQYVDGAFWGTHVQVKEYTFEVRTGDVLMVEFGCTVKST